MNSGNSEIFRSRRSQMVCKICVLKTFAKFTGKHRVGFSFFMKLQAEKFPKIHKKTPVLVSRF